MAYEASFGTLNSDVSPPSAGGPFRVAIFGDFSGRANRGERGDRDEISGRKPQEVAADKLDDLLAKYEARLTLPFGRDGGKIDLAFEELDQFHPERLLREADLVMDLIDLKGRVGRQAKQIVEWGRQFGAWGPLRPATRPAYGRTIAPVQAFSDFTQWQSVATAESAGGGKLPEMIAQAVGGRAGELDDPSEETLEEIVHHAIGDAIREIVHHPDYQALEAAWRGVDFIARRTFKGEKVKIVLFDVTAEELAVDLASADDLVDSAIYDLLVNRTWQAAGGGDPWAMVVGLYEFDLTPPHAELLGRLGKLGSLLQAPFLASMSQRVLGDEFALDGDEKAVWNELRSQAEAGWLGLATPGFLLRPPIGEGYKPFEDYSWEEFSAEEGAAGLLWGDPSLAVACLLAQDYMRAGWTFKPGAKSELPAVPMFVHRTEDDQTTYTVAQTFTSKIGQQVVKFGGMPLLGVRGRDAIEVGKVVSLAIEPSDLLGRWERPEAGDVPSAAGKAAASPLKSKPSSSYGDDEMDDGLAALMGGDDSDDESSGDSSSDDFGSSDDDEPSDSTSDAFGSSDDEPSDSASDDVTSGDDDLTSDAPSDDLSSDDDDLSSDADSDDVTADDEESSTDADSDDLTSSDDDDISADAASDDLSSDDDLSTDASSDDVSTDADSEDLSSDSASDDFGSSDEDSSSDDDDDSSNDDDDPYAGLDDDSSEPTREPDPAPPPKPEPKPEPLSKAGRKPSKDPYGDLKKAQAKEPEPEPAASSGGFDFEAYLRQGENVTQSDFSTAPTVDFDNYWGEGNRDAPGRKAPVDDGPKEYEEEEDVDDGLAALMASHGSSDDDESSGGSDDFGSFGDDDESSSDSDSDDLSSSDDDDLSSSDDDDLSSDSSSDDISTDADSDDLSTDSASDDLSTDSDSGDLSADDDDESPSDDSDEPSANRDDDLESMSDDDLDADADAEDAEDEASDEPSDDLDDLDADLDADDDASSEEDSADLSASSDEPASDDLDEDDEDDDLPSDDDDLDSPSDEETPAGDLEDVVDSSSDGDEPEADEAAEEDDPYAGLDDDDGPRADDDEPTADEEPTPDDEPAAEDDYPPLDDDASSDDETSDVAASSDFDEDEGESEMSTAEDTDLDPEGQELLAKIEAGEYQPFANGSPTILNFPDLIQPISEDEPAGDSRAMFTYKEKFDENRKEINPDNWDADDPMRPSEPKFADWHGTIELAQEALTTRCKHLQIASYMLEGLTKLHGFAGLRDGLHLMRLLVTVCWNRVLPEIEDPDEDLERRAGPFNWFDEPTRSALFPNTVRQIPVLFLHEDGFGWQQWKDSQEQKRGMKPEMIEQAVLATPRDRIQTAFDDATACLVELQEIGKYLDRKMGSVAPGMTMIRAAVSECRQFLQQSLQRKGPAASELAEADHPGESGGAVVPAAGGDYVAGTVTVSGGAASVEMVRRPVTRDDIYRQLKSVAEQLARMEPHSPVPYLIERCVALGAMPFPMLMKALISDMNVIAAMNRELGIQDENAAQEDNSNSGW